MAMSTEKKINEEVMENEAMELEVIETPEKEESKIKKIWNKAKKPLAVVAVVATAFGAGVVTDKLVSGGSSDSEDNDEEEIVEE